MSYFAVDIETMPNLEAIKWLPEVKAKANLKDPEKIKADIEKKKQEQIGKMALSPEFGKIACIGIYGENRKEVLVGDEKEILVSFLLWLGSQEHGARFVTYNGKGFDFDFIFKRAIFHDEASLSDVRARTDKYRSNSCHIDLMAEYCQYGKYLKLDLLASIYLGEKKIEFDVKTIPELVKTEEGINKLKEYCLKDCELIYKLAKKFGY